jgi:capsular exopolysaccharide synthesis family protein
MEKQAADNGGDRMSRLYEALSRASAGRRLPDAAPQDLLPSVAAPFEPKKTAEHLRNVTPLMPLETEAAVAMDEARLVTVQASPASRLVAWSDPNSLGAEKFRALVTRLDHVRKEIKLKSLQVTSSVVHEGKTLVAANLAVTLANYSGSKTLLIEGDLHRPTLASLFGLRDLTGLSHWWSDGNKDLAHFLYRFNGTPLWFLAAGKAQDQPSDILGSARLAEAFVRLSGWFDWTVVDSTPMLPIIDANLWSRLLDGTLLVVREGVTPVKNLKKGLQALDHPKLIGVVLNETSECDHSKYGGYYYGAEDGKRRPAKVR